MENIKKYMGCMKEYAENMKQCVDNMGEYEEICGWMRHIRVNASTVDHVFTLPVVKGCITK